jgi:4'-phosphopantetheinyl transferase
MSVFITTPDSKSADDFKDQKWRRMKTECGASRDVRVSVAACPATFARAPEINEVFAWVVDLTRPPVPPAELFRRLTTDERARAERYLIATVREQFVIGRGLLRGLLGDCLGCAPEAVPLTQLPTGKPVLAGQPPALHFNVTHTDGVLVLVAGRRRVGVDVERVRELRADVDGLVNRYFSLAEGIEFRALPVSHRLAAFFRGWTCKEAVIKAAGGTVGCLANFDVELRPDRPPRVNAVRDPQLDGPGWALTEWVANGNVAVALAVEGASGLLVERSEE